MKGFWVYKGDERRLINRHLWASTYEGEGWSRTPPAEEEAPPSLNFLPYTDANLLHVAAVTNVVAGASTTRHELEEAIREMWSANGKPRGWIESALAMSAPVSIDDAADLTPPINSESEATEGAPSDE